MWIVKGLKKIATGNSEEKKGDCVRCIEEWIEPSPSLPRRMMPLLVSQVFDGDYDFYAFFTKLKGHKIFYLRQEYKNRMKCRLLSLIAAHSLLVQLGPLTESYKSKFIHDEINETWLWYYYQFYYLFSDMGREAPDGFAHPHIKDRLSISLGTSIVLLRIHYELATLCHRYLAVHKKARQKLHEELVYIRMRETQQTIDRMIMEEVDLCMQHRHEFILWTTEWNQYYPKRMIYFITLFEDQLDAKVLPRLFELRDELRKVTVGHKEMKLRMWQVDFSEFLRESGHVELSMDINPRSKKEQVEVTLEPTGFRTEPTGFRTEPTGFRTEPTGFRTKHGILPGGWRYSITDVYL